jgi:serine/threonine-protein kinase
VRQASSRGLGYRRGVTAPSEPSGQSAPPPSDRLLGGRYRLGPIVGRGGMATIYRATDVRTEHEVAVKILRPEVATDRDLAHRFRREALAATVLRHPNIVACLDTGTDGHQAYLVMALVDGEDLAARLRRSGRLAPWQVAHIGLDVARGLGVAHVRGIVHRDVKPGNILLARDGRAMVTDFGIARLAADAEGAVPGTTLGSVHYFSPEQAKG